jgi:hypothetical protein
MDFKREGDRRTAFFPFLVYTVRPGITILQIHGARLKLSSACYASEAANES